MLAKQKLHWPPGYALLDWVILGLLALLYTPLLLHWVDGWLNKSISIQHEYFSHGLIGLPFAAYISWGYGRQWQQLPHQSHWLGAGSLALATIFYLSAVPDLMNLSFPLVLVGLCLWLKGMAGLRLQAFPLLLVTLATPTQLPYLIEPYILPLQQFIAGMAGFILLQFDMDVRISNISLFVNDQIVEVAPHCAGLKMLFTSFYVGLMLLYWTGVWRNRGQTWLFLSGIAVVSVSANIIRNTLLTFFHGTGRQAAFEWLHDSWGGDVYSAILLGSLVVLLNAIQQYYPIGTGSTPPTAQQD